MKPLTVLALVVFIASAVYLGRVCWDTYQNHWFLVEVDTVQEMKIYRQPKGGTMYVPYGEQKPYYAAGHHSEAMTTKDMQVLKRQLDKRF